MNDKNLAYKQTQVLYDKKWQQFLRLAWVFRYIPFIEGVMGNGSMAIGNVSEKSDFDVLILARERRIFTARAFSIFFFGLLGVRRSKYDHGPDAANKVCLNHFIAPSAFHFKDTNNGFWKLLYQKLVPVYGSTRVLNSFFNANSDWLDKQPSLLDQRYQYKTPSNFKKFIEKVFSKNLGDWLEARLKKLQVNRIEKGLKKDISNPGTVRVVFHKENIADAKYFFDPLIKYNDKELQFHPDPAVIELKKL